MIRGSCSPPLPGPFRRLPERSRDHEILDREGAVDDAALLRSLREMSRVNRYLGGTRSILASLRPMARGRRELRLLDLGVGIGDVPREIAAALGRRGVRVRWTGVDRGRRVLALADRAKRPPGDLGAEIRSEGDLLTADARTLPFPDDSFDVVISSLVLHHLSWAEARAFLTEAARVARLGVVISDLERRPLHYLGARILAATVWRRDPVTRCDGPRSVLRAFRRDELRELCAGLPFERVRIRRRPVFRVVIEGVSR